MGEANATITFELDSDVYWTMRQNATSLSQVATVAIASATRVPRSTRRRITCSRPAAEEIRDWLKDHARAYLDMEGHQYKAPACQRAAEAIDASLQ